MGRKKEKKAKSSPTTMTYVTEDDDVKVVPVDMADIKIEPNVIEPGTRPYNDAQCHLCHKVMKHKHALKMHMLTHTEKTIKCDECDMMFTTTATLGRHKKCKHMDLNLRPFPCTMCELRFFNNSHLAAHIKTHTGERDVTCGLCFQSFYSKADLVRHMKGRHLNIRSFTCHLCNKGFFRKSYLKLHLLTVHINDEDIADSVTRCYSCRYCKKIFQSRTTCYAHERSHNGTAEQRALCMICGKTFSRPASLKKHLEKHNGPPKLKCEVCDRPFYHPSSLKRHLLIHNRPDPDICQVCGTVYTNRDAFRRHLKKHVARGDLAELPPLEREPPRISKMQALIRKGVDLDEILKTCKVEVVELGGKNNSNYTRDKERAVNALIEVKSHPKFVLEVNDLNNTLRCSTREQLEEDLEHSNVPPTCEQIYTVESWGNYFTVVSDDFQTIVKDNAVAGVVGDGEAKNTAMIFSLKSCLDTDEITSTDMSDVNAELFSTVTEIEIPNYVEEIPEIKPEFLLYGRGEVFHFFELSQVVDVEPVDMSADIFVVDRTLSRNLRDILSPLQVVKRNTTPVDVDKALVEYEGHAHATLPQFRNTDLLYDFRMFIDPKVGIVQWTDEEIQLKISKILYGETKVYSINNALNITEDSEQLDEFVDKVPKKKTLPLIKPTPEIEKTKTKKSKTKKSRRKKATKASPEVTETPNLELVPCKIEQEDPVPEVGSPAMDDFIYEDMVDPSDHHSEDPMDTEYEPPTDYHSDTEPDIKPNMELLEPKSEPELSESPPDENKENRTRRTRRRKRRISETSNSEYEESLEKRRKRSGKKKRKVKKKSGKKYVKKSRTHVKEEIDERECPWNYNTQQRLVCTEFICFYCNKNFAHKGSLRTHISSQHMMDKACSCHQCGMCFISKSRLEAHIENVHLKIRNFQCTWCEWGFYSHADLERHERRHTGVKPFMCHLCSKTFVRKAQLKSHIVIHSGERSFICNVCGKSFATRSTLSTHLKRHADGMPVRFYKLPGMDAPRRTPGEPPVCNECGKELSTVHSLKRHNDLVHVKKNVKPRVQKAHQCPVCPNSFSHKTSMQRHMYKAHKTYREERTRGCPVCGRRLLNEICVLRHMVKKHPENCDNIEAMNAAVSKALQRHIPCPICKRKYQKDSGLQKHLVKKHYYKSEVYDNVLGYNPLPTPPTAPPSDLYDPPPDEKPNLLLL